MTQHIPRRQWGAFLRRVESCTNGAGWRELQESLTPSQIPHSEYNDCLQETPKGKDKKTFESL